MRRLVDPEVRRWLYGIALAVSALLGVLGVLEGQVIAAVNGVLAALFGLALANVPDVDPPR